MYVKLSLFLDVMSTRSNLKREVGTAVPCFLDVCCQDSYLVLFLEFAASIFLVNGMVSSTRTTEVGEVFVLTITKSGLEVVTIMFGGTVPPLTFPPSISAYTDIPVCLFSVSIWYR